MMTALFYFGVFLVLAYPSYFILKVFFRRTSPWWRRNLFPLGYALYNTRFGYGLHLKKLKKGRPQPHSIVGHTSLALVKVVPVAVLDDNYSYLVIDTVTNTAVAIDPCDPTPVMEAMLENRVALKAILTTHKHWDHSGGNQLLRKRYPELKVYGGSSEQVPGMTDQVQDGEILRIGRMKFKALWTPGHTRGHMVYLLQNEPPCLFSGDHIFICGTGQIFEATAETMMESITKVKNLPKNTLVFPGHEYTLRNVKFALHLLPTNAAIQTKWQWVRQQRDRELSTVPSILSEELTYNPFLFTESPDLKDALGMTTDSTPAQVLAEVRKQKNIYDRTFI